MKKKEKPCAFPWNGITKLLRIMRLTFLIILIGLMKVSAVSYSQQSKLTMNVHNLALKDALGLIEDQSNYVFFYNADQIELDDKVNLSFVNKSVSEILDELLNGKEITYKVTDRRIVLYPKEIKSNSVQQKNVTGNVSDSSSQPLPGVSIIIKGTTIGTVTDFDGNFSLTNVPEDATLIFSFLGMKTQEVEAAAQSVFNVVMEEDAIGIEEVVAVGYGTQKKVSLTSAVGALDGETLKARPSTDVRQLLQGRLTGLTITDKGGAPGGQNLSLNIRGITSLGDTNPLVIVDGIEQYFEDVNPQDIESVSVLKDASSTAIYGSRAANGVILITTKRAKEGSVKISYNGYFGLQKSNNIPIHMEMEDYMRMQNTAWINTTGEPIYTESYIEEYVNATDRIKYPFPNKWHDAMLKIAPMHSHTISATGGNDKTKSYLSLRYVDQEGVITNFSSDIYEVRSNTDFKISDQLNVSADLNFRRKKIIRPVEEFRSVYTMLQTSQWTVPRYPDGTYGISSDGHSPLMYAEKSGINKEIWSYLVGGLNVNWKIVEGLHFKSQIAGSLNFGNKKRYQNKYEIHDYYNQEIIKKSQSVNSLTEGREYTSEITINNILNYTKAINNNQIDVLLGYSEIFHEGNNMSAYRRNFYSNDIQSLSQGTDDGTKDNSGSEYTWGLRSYFTRLNYSYNGKYLFEANARYDGSSRFYGDNKYSFFPSFSSGWRISQEKFWSSLVDVVNEFKVRGSYGVTGNQAVGLYSYFDTLTKGLYAFNNTIAEGYYRNTLANKDIHWETTSQWDVGMDLVFLDNKISFTADYYKKRTDGILLRLPVPGTLGLRPSVQNAGIVDNMGFEFELGLRNRFGHFGLDFTQTFSTNKNEVVDLAGTGPNIVGDVEIRFVIDEGLPYRGFWGYRTDGLFQTEEEVANYPTLQTGAAPGDVKYLDLNNDGVINNGDMTYLGGSFFPKYTFSSDINLSYKNFGLNLFFQGAAGTKRYVGGAIMQMGIWGGFTHEIFTDNYWTPDNPDARFPRPTKFEVRNTQLSDRNIQNGNYLRLKVAQLSYQIPSVITEKIGVEMMNIFISGTNLLTFSKLNEWDVDPEVDNRDAESRYPQTSVYSFGAQINF